MTRAMKLGTLGALASLTDIPLVMKQALAQTPGLGTNGKKLLFIFLRGANDALNSVIPIQDDGYAPSRPTLAIQKDGAIDYSMAGGCDMSAFNTTATTPTYNYTSAIRLGNGFAALHPSLKFLAPIYNAGDLALIQRVGYPRQSRSHFDSQNYWETGAPNDNSLKDGIFYRTIIESGLANSSPLTGVSFQGSLPLLLRGSRAAMTNLDDPTRYDLLGIPNDASGNLKAANFIRDSVNFPYPDKMNRELLDLQYKNMRGTLDIFAGINFRNAANSTGPDGNTFRDNTNLDGESQPYYLFPTSAAKNGGWGFVTPNDPNKYVVPNNNNTYTFFSRLKAAALVLNKTDAIIAGTALDGFDTHSAQGAVTGAHPNLQRTIAWALYGLRKYFMLNADKATWDNTIVVTLSEFGRTTIENGDAGTDHAEAGLMFVAGGRVKGYEAGRSGVFGCSPSERVRWVTGQVMTGTSPSTMFGASQRYLKRSYDYRSVVGKLIRDHLGASQEQLNRIIPGYAVTGQRLRTGGISSSDGVDIMGEPDIVLA